MVSISSVTQVSSTPDALLGDYVEVEFTLQCDPLDVSAISDVSVVTRTLTSWRTVNCTEVSIDYGAGTYTYRFGVRVSSDVEQMLRNSSAALVSMGFAVQCKVWGNGDGMEPWFAQWMFVDATGSSPGLTSVLSDDDYIVPVFVGQGFPGYAAPSVPPDWTDVYVNDEYEERVLETGAGSQTNPLYNVFEAIQLASMISVYYASGGVPRPVTVHVDPGEYEIMRGNWWFIPGGDVTVVNTDPSSTPFIYANEDLQYIYFRTRATKDTLSYSTRSPTMYNHRYSLWKDYGKLSISGLAFRALNFSGIFNELEFSDCDFTKCEFQTNNVFVLDKLTLQNNQTSDSRIEVKTSGTDTEKAIPPFWEYVEQGGVSTIWNFLKRFPIWDETELGLYVEDDPVLDPVTDLQSAGISPGSFQPMSYALNPYNTAKYHPNPSFQIQIPVSRFDFYTTPWEAMWKSKYTGDWSSAQAVFTIRNNRFRDSSRCSVDAGLGKVDVRNNISTYNMYVTGGHTVIVDNNTVPNLQLYVTVHEVTGTGTPVDIQFSEIGTSAPDDLLSSLDSYVTLGIIPYQVFNSALSDPFASFGRVRSVQNNITWSANVSMSGSYDSWSRQHLCNQWWLYFKSSGQTTLSSKSIAIDPGTKPQISLSTPASVQYNSGYVSGIESEFVDTVLFVLAPTSSFIDAGNPDAAYNDVDGTRNDLGAYGGPYGDAALKAWIRWVESFVEVNYVQLYEGVSVRLDGTYSTHSPQRTITYTWSEDAGNPASVTWSAENGTADGGVQTVTLPTAGTYTFYLTVDDGVSTDQTSVTLQVQVPRAYCVDPSKTFTNDIVGGVNLTDWTFVNFESGSSFSPVEEQVSVDIGQLDGVKMDWLAKRSISVTAGTRYYMKIRFAQQHLENYNADLGLFVVLLNDDTGEIFFTDRMFIKGTGLLNTYKNLLESHTYGVGSVYFAAPSSASSITVYLCTEHRTADQYSNYLLDVWIAPADERVDSIYQDARLAIRHAAVGDEVQLAGNAYIDVPIRVAGKKVAFTISGGWDPSSHDGSKYTVQDPVSFPTYLNYLRFAWFEKRQRDWTDRAISIFIPVYFDSYLKHVKVVNLNPDICNSYEYEAVDIDLTQHADVTFEGIEVEGILDAGVIRSVSDSTTPHNLNIISCSVADCSYGLFVLTKEIDVDVQACTFRRVLNSALEIVCGSVWYTPRVGKVRSCTFEDCCKPGIFAAGALNEDDPIYRKVAVTTPYADRDWGANWIDPWSSSWTKQRSSISTLAPLALIYTSSGSVRYEVYDNTFTDTGNYPFRPQFDICFGTDMFLFHEYGRGAELYVHNNTGGVGGLGFVGLLSPFSEAKYSRASLFPADGKSIRGAEKPSLTTKVANWKSGFATTDEAVSALLNRTTIETSFIVVENNTVNDTRGLLCVALDGGDYVQLTPVIIRNNSCSGVYAGVWTGPLSYLCDEVVNDALQHVWTIEGNTAVSNLFHCTMQLGTKSFAMLYSLLVRGRPWLDLERNLVTG